MSEQGHPSAEVGRHWATSAADNTKTSDLTSSVWCPRVRKRNVGSVRNSVIASARLVTSGGDDAPERAFEAIVAAHVRRLYSLALPILDDAGEAEDAVQETLLKAWRARDSVSSWFASPWQGFPANTRRQKAPLTTEELKLLVATTPRVTVGGGTIAPCSSLASRVTSVAASWSPSTSRTSTRNNED